MKKTLFTIAMIASAQASALELAKDEAYITAGLQLTDYDVSVLDDSIGFNVGIGAPLTGLNISNPKIKFGVEGGYVYFGESSKNDWTASGSSIYGAGKMNFALNDKASLYAKAGLNYVTVEVEYDVNTQFGNFSSSADDSEIKLLWGFGGELKLNDKMSAGVGYTSYASDITSLNANVNFRF